MSKCERKQTVVGKLSRILGVRAEGGRYVHGRWQEYDAGGTVQPHREDRTTAGTSLHHHLHKGTPNPFQLFLAGEPVRCGRLR